MATVLLVIIGIVVLFGLTIFVHELGHFLVARWCGLKVEAFSIGFGPALWQKEINGVKYKVGAIPAGGYVALPQMDPMFGTEGAASERHDPSLPAISPPRKILVAVAGVVMNMLFALLIAWVVYWVGMPSIPEQHNTVVGYVDESSQVYEAGLRIGDEILTVNGDTVSNWQEIIPICVLYDDLVLEFRSGEAQKTLETTKDDLGLGDLNGRRSISGENFCMVLSVVKDSSAEQAGIQGGDRIVGLDGAKVHSQTHLIALVDKYRDQDVPVTILRDGKEITTTVTPRYYPDDDQVRLGIAFNNYWKDNTFLIHPKPMDQIRSHARLIFQILRALVNPKTARNAGENIGGPPAILYMLYMMISSSLITALWFTGLINVNLAIINLLPIPILDGGHIVFSVWEWITKRPVHPKFMLVVSNLFFVLLIGLFLFLSYRDITKLIIPHVRQSRAAETESVAPTNAPPDQVPAPEVEQSP